MRAMLRLSSFIFVTAFSLSCFADWSLKGDESNLQFVTTKATHVAEVHSFKRLTGSIDAKGAAKLDIDLTSVDTKIEIRDQRMQEVLFETNLYPKATLTAQLPVEKLKLKVGEETSVDIVGTLSIHGVTQTVNSVAVVTKLANGNLVAQSQSPILLNADNVGLAAGVEKLREVAGLPNISHSVSVSYRLTFESN